MTREEATKILGSLFLVVEVLKVDKEKRKEIKIALDMAIKALLEPTRDTKTGNCISRQDALEALDRIGSLDTEADREYARDIFDNLPSITPAVNEDCISRQDAIEAMRLATAGERPLERGDVLDILYSITPVTPTERIGEWVGVVEYCKHLEEETREQYQPSGIGNTIYCNQCWSETIRKSDYCPNCGADMKGNREVRSNE